MRIVRIRELRPKTEEMKQGVIESMPEGKDMYPKPCKTLTLSLNPEP